MIPQFGDVFDLEDQTKQAMNGRTNEMHAVTNKSPICFALQEPKDQFNPDGDNHD